MLCQGPASLVQGLSLDPVAARPRELGEGGGEVIECYEKGC